MSCPVGGREPGAPLWRIARGDRPWTFPDYAYVGGERFDDPRGEYRILYGATQRLGAFVEVLAPFRPPPGSTPSAGASLTTSSTPPGVVPSSWRLRRHAGAAVVEGLFADLGSAEWLGYLHEQLKALLIEEGIPEFDAAVLRESTNLRMTQAASRLVFECLAADGEPQFDGVYYESRYGNDLECWALFERGIRRMPYHVASDTFREEDPEFNRACRILGLEIEPL